MNNTDTTPELAEPKGTLNGNEIAPAAIWVRRVLVVEDDADTRLAWGKLLMQRGFEAVVVADGLRALEVFEELDPEVILLDLVMPRMNGFKFLHTLRHERQEPLPPIVVITGREESELDEKLRSFGVARALRKPCKSHEVVEALREALGDQ